MAESTARVFIDAPLDIVWRLASDPDRQTEWWPDTIVFDCGGQQFEQGCKVRNIDRLPWPLPTVETTLEVEEFQPGHEIFVRCLDTGTYASIVLTKAQDGTYIECVAGIDPENLKYRIFDVTVGQRIFRRWVEHATDKLREAAQGATPV
jgi:hypothetical protein